MDDTAIAQAVEILAAMRRREAAPDELPESCRPQTVADGYRIQAALNEHHASGDAGPVAGHKIGCTSRVMQEYLKIDEPCSGAMHAANIVEAFSERPHAIFHTPGVECEIAVRLGRDLPPSGAPFDRAAVADAVEACMPSIEIVDDRWSDFQGVSTPSMIADDFFNWGSAIGAPVANWRNLDMEAMEGVMFVNGEEVGRGHGRDVLGHPFEVLTWLANSLASRGRGLRAGEVVTTGSLVKTAWCEPGDEVRIAIEGLGETGITFTA